MMALLALSSAFLRAQPSQPAKQVQAGRGKQAPPGQDKANTTPPINVTVTTPERTPAEKEEDRKRAERQDATNQRIAEANDRIAGFTFWLVVVGALEAGGTVLAFMVAIRAANAAKKSADVAERALRTAERAWMGATDFTASLNVPQPVVTCRMNNTGHSTAILKTGEYVAWWSTELPDMPTYKDVVDEGNVSIAGGHHYDRRMNIPNLTEQVRQAIEAGTVTLWFYGRLKYTDAFKETHETGFCVVYEPGRDKMAAERKAAYNYAD
jgi:hypothetical protein